MKADLVAGGVNGLAGGLGAPTNVRNRVFDPKLPGSWLVDLSHVDLSRAKVGKDKPDVYRHRRVPSRMFRAAGNHAAGQ
ncbi:hypothetical protein AB0L10_40390 [Streptomyces flaveolus]|uniref:hypothetical protein n=1 Tax=Streptomyces flaveolus TaxID=67297 RepID=UPI0034496EFC